MFAKKDIFYGIIMIIEYLSTDALTLQWNVKHESNDWNLFSKSYFDLSSNIEYIFVQRYCYLFNFKSFIFYLLCLLNIIIICPCYCYNKSLNERNSLTPLYNISFDKLILNYLNHLCYSNMNLNDTIW